jgi:hypothetical protein
MKTMADEAADLEAMLNEVRDRLAAAVEGVQSLRGRMEEVGRASDGDASATLDTVQRLVEEQHSTMNEARQKGVGPGLYRVLDEAQELDGQQQELLGRLKNGNDDADSRRGVLQQFRDLEQQQHKLLLTELGKFEAQGLRPMLDRFLALAEQQEALIRQLVQNGGA